MIGGIAALLLAAALGHVLALRTRLPSLPLLILCGVLLARTGLVPAPLLEDALVLGVTFLVFVAGVELDAGRVRMQWPAALRVGVVQFFVLGAAGFLAALALRYDALSALYLGLALTASSTHVVVRLLQRRARLFEPGARLVLGVLLLQDILVVLLIPAVMRMPAGGGAVLRGSLAGLGALVVAYLWLHLVTPRLLRLAHDEDLTLLVALATPFLFVALARALGLPGVVGAFLAGVSLARFPVNVVVRPQLQSIGDFFAAIFFTALGALAVPAASDLLHALLLAVLVVVVTTPLVTLLAVRRGFSTRAALESGLLLSQTSEISLVVGLQGMLAQQIAPRVFTVIVLVTVLTMALTPLLVADRVVWRLLRWYPGRRRPFAALPARDHVLLLGAGTTGMPLLETLLAASQTVLAVDDDPAVIAALRAANVPHIRGEASDLLVLQSANAQAARVISSTIRRPEDNRRLLEYARGVRVLVRVFEQRDAAWVRAAGGTPVLYSEAAAEGFLRWFDAWRAANATVRVPEPSVIAARDGTR